jgi:hypothetical protein
MRKKSIFFRVIHNVDDELATIFGMLRRASTPNLTKHNIVARAATEGVGGRQHAFTITDI